MPDDQATPRYHAVILYYRFGRDVLHTLNCVATQVPPPTTITVVDNHSCDGLAQLLTAFPHQTRIITAPENLGYGKGMNLGAAALDLQPGDFLLFLTHEVSLKESCVNQLIHTALSTNAALVGPVLRRSRDQSVWSVGGYLDRLGIPRHYTAIHDSDQISSNVQWLDGAVLACRASDFKAAGGFSEDYFLYWEDIDIADRLRPLGRIVCALHAQASQDTATTPLYFMARNQLRYWLNQGRYDKAAFAIFLTFFRSLKQDYRLGARNRARIRARINGLKDGVRGSLELQGAFLR